jgi:hypothetical protein
METPMIAYLNIVGLQCDSHDFNYVLDVLAVFLCRLLTVKDGIANMLQTK